MTLEVNRAMKYFEMNIYVPGIITTLNRLLRRTAYTSRNLYHQSHKQFYLFQHSLQRNSQIPPEVGITSTSRY